MSVANLHVPASAIPVVDAPLLAALPARTFAASLGSQLALCNEEALSTAFAEIEAVLAAATEAFLQSDARTKHARAHQVERLLVLARAELRRVQAQNINGTEGFFHVLAAFVQGAQSLLHSDDDALGRSEELCAVASLLEVILSEMIWPTQSIVDVIRLRGSQVRVAQ